MAKCMRICSCCHDPVVYPVKLSDNSLSTVIYVHDELPTFIGTKDGRHALCVRVSHEHLEKLGMQYKGAFGNEHNKMWHMPDGRVISSGGGKDGVSWALIRNGGVGAME
jgi:hypothetical protein